MATRKHQQTKTVNKTILIPTRDIIIITHTHQNLDVGVIDRFLYLFIKITMKLKSL